MLFADCPVLAEKPDEPSYNANDRNQRRDLEHLNFHSISTVVPWTELRDTALRAAQQDEWAEEQQLNTAPLLDDSALSDAECYKLFGRKDPAGGQGGRALDNAKTMSEKGRDERVLQARGAGAHAAPSCTCVTPEYLSSCSHPP